MKRREFLKTSTVLSVGALANKSFTSEPKGGTERTFHVCFNTEILDEEPELLTIVRDAGINTIWLAGFLYGYWYYSSERIDYWKKRIVKMGTACNVVNVPIGHPGDSLGAKSGKVPLTPPNHWKLGVQVDGKTYAGTSLHSPATEENIEALKKLQAIGIKKVFLDDDFRLARGPGIIGGCFCDEHCRQFLNLHGYNEKHWKELLDAVKNRELSQILREWINFTCDGLSSSFKAQQLAAPGIQLGIMVMYLGAEKAGIRLTDYKGVPVRVGELMFDDGSFTPVKGKTDELFSVLFHRHFVKPDLAYSETTAYPANRLSARNMAAKLVISTIGDVRNSMFMSGLTPFPVTHWQTLAPAMKNQTEIHKQIAGHKTAGPFKHFWGEHSRWVGNDKPYSLFLASGIPFEVTETPAGNGWTFLSDFDTRASVGEKLRSNETTLIFDPERGRKIEKGIAVKESLQDIFAFKHTILSQLHDVPFVEEDIPVVCAWYPTARSVLLWNLSEKQEKLTLKFKEMQRTVKVEGLDSVLLRDII